MNRRRVACAVVGIIVFCGGLSAVDAGQHKKKCGLEGTWLVKVLFAEGTEFETRLQYLQTFNKDGRTTLLLPTGGPPDYAETGDPRIGCMGEWRPRARTRRPVFDITTWCLPTQQWVPTGPDPTSYQELQVKARLVRGGKVWRGPFVISNYDADGNQVFTGPGVMRATRLRMNPLP